MPRLRQWLPFLFLVSCVGAAPYSVLNPEGDSFLAERSLLLLIADRKEYEDFTAQRALMGPPELRRELALALGRSGHPQGLRVLEGLTYDDVAAVREEAILALGVGGFTGAEDILFRLASGPSPEESRLAIEALARASTRLEANGPEPRPGPEAELLARLESAQAGSAHLGRAEGVRDLLALGLGDEDPGRRASVLRWLVDHPILAYEALWASYRLALKDFILAPRLLAVSALAARGLAEPLDRGAVVRLLEKLAEDRDFLVRRRAIAGLARLGRPVPRLGGVESGRGAEIYREILARLEEPRRVTLRLAGEGARGAGTVEIELFCREAPLTCTSFLQLVAQGFYNDLPFFRVEPGQWLLTGDPRGDGWGGPGYTLREEISRKKPLRGTLVMLSAQPGGLGPDTAGSQFQILLADQPAWNGQVTVFGRVVEGLELLDGVGEGGRVKALSEG
jgi:peptidyl-prolyl cis-trans isomerase B (cyclophilin B)